MAGLYWAPLRGLDIRKDEEQKSSNKTGNQIQTTNKKCGQAQNQVAGQKIEQAARLDSVVQKKKKQ